MPGREVVAERRKLLPVEVDRRHVHPSPPSITDNSSDIPYKDRETYDLAEDVYAFIVAAPVFSTPFALAIGVIITKYVVFACLLKGILGDANWGDTQSITDLIVKFFLTPVSLAMQSDLMEYVRF